MDFKRLIAALNDYVIVASVIVIAIRNSIYCAALLAAIDSVGSDTGVKPQHRLCHLATVY